MKRRKLNDPDKRTKNLLELVEERLNLDFDTFLRGIISEKEFESYRNKIKKKDEILNLKIENEIKKEFNYNQKSDYSNDMKIKRKTHNNELIYPSFKLNESDNILKISLAARNPEEKQTAITKTESTQSLGNSSFEGNNDIVILLHPKSEDDL